MTQIEKTPNEKPRHRSWSFWLGLCVALACLTWAIGALDWSGVRHQLTQARFAWLLAATAALFARIASRTARWLIFFPPPRPAFGPALAALMFGQTVNYVAPVWAGDLGRAYLLGDWTGYRKGLTLGTVVLDKLCDLVLFLLFLTILPIWIDLPPWLGSVVQTVGLVAMLGIATVLLGLVRRDWVLTIATQICRPLSQGWREKVLGLISLVLDGLAALRHPSTLALALAWSLILWGWDAAAHYFVFRALQLDLPLIAAVFLSTALRAGFALPTMPGQVGVYEGIVVIGLALFEVDNETALGVGLLRHAVDLIPPLIITLLLLAVRQISRSRTATHKSGTG